ncbi:MAG TPA: L-seryl-tRNA(Sec) selenium transferase, partial [Thermomicrobiales bacterium]|nr:L-seryl-tRNA(Sec) selenium transferase [Thermomicrobiales bacterium]
MFSGVNPNVATVLARGAQNRARALVLAGDLSAAGRIERQLLEDLQLVTDRSPATVINGSGVIVQTNLGRAPVSRETGAAMQAAAERYVALETNLETGERGGRGSAIEAQLRALTGAERTLVVNNNAAAVFLTLSALCHGREVVVSRGEAVEIGGGFRIPDVLRQSGALLVEVGTTNRTYARDYEAAVTQDTRAFLKVHASNFAMIGFTAAPGLDELVRVTRKRNILLIEDVGSGCLLSTERFGLRHEPTLRESIEAGADIVCASGDKLLGGPQAGLILGRKEYVDIIARHPLARAVRADKTCLAGLSATLGHYIGNDATDAIPVWWSISRTDDWLLDRARTWAAQLPGVAEVVESVSVIGGGSLPGATLPSHGIGLRYSGGATALAFRLRTGPTCVVP